MTEWYTGPKSTWTLSFESGLKDFSSSFLKAFSNGVLTLNESKFGSSACCSFQAWFRTSKCSNNCSPIRVRFFSKLTLNHLTSWLNVSSMISSLIAGRDLCIFCVNSNISISSDRLFIKRSRFMRAL
ncbi:hypothetical protein OGAPHI_002578 [Ogataea philodendri]|uniref:Uncharacterized protein n=1 Tax=Ogataea philodendri TaxID=1378263 RepID=A0A9P8T765_9ASCO|nr:uncharacterized protein OGAPHI_002578 [Ogataea philodendri]KAH3668823.1 hypothetical protein OGAPHI_002578 [Ogataea philodendri]